MENGGEVTVADLKLAKLPDRTPIKLAITVTPELHRALNDYAQVYEATYGQRESVADLIPFMLASFLESDRTFVKQRSGIGRNERSL
jgi:hypothetical protein